MKVYLYELSEDPKELHFSKNDAWLVQAVEETQEAHRSVPPEYTVDLELRKLQDIVFLKGRMVLGVGLLCSRCANNFDSQLEANFQCLFTRERQLENPENNVGIAHSEPTGATEEDLDIEYLEKDYIELADVLKEQIYLKIPVQPLCKEGCKGLCSVCGQDQNTHPCQCHRLKNTAMANALKNYLE